MFSDGEGVWEEVPRVTDEPLVREWRTCALPTLAAVAHVRHRGNPALVEQVGMGKSPPGSLEAPRPAALPGV